MSQRAWLSLPGVPQTLNHQSNPEGGCCLTEPKQGL